MRLEWDQHEELSSLDYSMAQSDSDLNFDFYIGVGLDSDFGWGIDYEEDAKEDTDIYQRIGLEDEREKAADIDALRVISIGQQQHWEIDSTKHESVIDKISIC